MDHGSPSEQRGAFEGDLDATHEGVLLVLARGEHELALELAGELQRVALVRARVPETRSMGLGTVEVAGPIREPGLGVPRRRLVGARVVVLRTRDVLGSCHTPSSLGAELQPVNLGLVAACTLGAVVDVVDVGVGSVDVVLELAGGHALSSTTTCTVIEVKTSPGSNTTAETPRWPAASVARSSWAGSS